MRASMISVEGLREPVEEARLTVELAARHAERDLVGAEEHLQHAQVRAVEAEVPGRVLGVGRGEERRPRRVGPVAGLSSRSASWIACQGRQKSQ